MNEFSLWFVTGFEHITAIEGYDHILFVSLLVFAFSLNQWKKLLVLVTAFTLGHSVSLFMSVTGIVYAPRLLTELLIAGTILATALYQLFKKSENQKEWVLYSTVTLFGLVHGLGFSFLLKSMLSKSESPLLPLLYFNLGLEVGQLIIIALVVLFSLLLTSLLKLPFKLYKQIITCIIALTALKLCAERSWEFFLS